MTLLRYTSITGAVWAALISHESSALATIDPDITAFINRETRVIETRYLKGDAVVVEHLGTAPAPTSLAFRLATDVTDTLDVAPLPTGPGYARASIYDSGYSSVQINAQLIMEIWDYSGFSGDGNTPNPFNAPSGAIGLQLSYEVIRDGETRYRTQSDFWGGRDGVINLNRFSNNVLGTDLSGETVFGFGLPDYFGSVGEQPRGLSFDDKLVTDLDLGWVNPFESFAIEAIMQAQLIMPATRLGAGGRIGIGDPNKVTGSGFGNLYIGPAQSLPQPAPVRAPLSLLIGGFVALLITRHRRGEQSRSSKRGRMGSVIGR